MGSHDQIYNYFFLFNLEHHKTLFCTIFENNFTPTFVRNLNWDLVLRMSIKF